VPANELLFRMKKTLFEYLLGLSYVPATAATQSSTRPHISEFQPPQVSWSGDSNG